MTRSYSAIREGSTVNRVRKLRKVLVTFPDAAMMLEITAEEVEALVSERQLEVVRIGAELRITVDSVDAVRFS